MVRAKVDWRAADGNVVNIVLHGLVPVGWLHERQEFFKYGGEGRMGHSTVQDVYP